MKSRNLLIHIIYLLFFGTALSFSNLAADESSKPVLAILSNPQLDRHADLLEEQINQNSRYRFVERTRIRKIFEEHKLKSFTHRKYWLKELSLLKADGLLLLINEENLINLKFVGTKFGVVLLERFIGSDLKTYTKTLSELSKELIKASAKLNAELQSQLFVSILPFVNKNVSKKHDTVGEALRRLLSIRLNHHPDIVVLDRHDLFEIVKEHDLGSSMNFLAKTSTLIVQLYFRVQEENSSTSINLDVELKQKGNTSRHTMEFGALEKEKGIDQLCALIQKQAKTKKFKSWNRTREAQSLAGQGRLMLSHKDHRGIPLMESAYFLSRNNSYRKEILEYFRLNFDRKRHPWKFLYHSENAFQEGVSITFYFRRLLNHLAGQRSGHDTHSLNELRREVRAFGERAWKTKWKDLAFSKKIRWSGYLSMPLRWLAATSKNEKEAFKLLKAHTHEILTALEDDQVQESAAFSALSRWVFSNSNYPDHNYLKTPRWNHDYDIRQWERFCASFYDHELPWLDFIARVSSHSVNPDMKKYQALLKVLFDRVGYPKEAFPEKFKSKFRGIFGDITAMDPYLFKKLTGPLVDSKDIKSLNGHFIYHLAINSRQHKKKPDDKVLLESFQKVYDTIRTSKSWLTPVMEREIDYIHKRSPHLKSTSQPVKRKYRLIFDQKNDPLKRHFRYGRYANMKLRFHDMIRRDGWLWICMATHNYSGNNDVVVLKVSPKTMKPAKRWVIHVKEKAKMSKKRLFFGCFIPAMEYAKGRIYLAIHGVGILTFSEKSDTTSLVSGEMIRDLGGVSTQHVSAMTILSGVVYFALANDGGALWKHELATGRSTLIASSKENTQSTPLNRCSAYEIIDMSASGQRLYFCVNNHKMQQGYWSYDLKSGQFSQILKRNVECVFITNNEHLLTTRYHALSFIPGENQAKVLMGNKWPPSSRLGNITFKDPLIQLPVRKGGGPYHMVYNFAIGREGVWYIHGGNGINTVAFRRWKSTPNEIRVYPKDYLEGERPMGLYPLNQGALLWGQGVLAYED